MIRKLSFLFLFGLILCGGTSCAHPVLSAHESGIFEQKKGKRKKSGRYKKKKKLFGKNNDCDCPKH